MFVRVVFIGNAAGSSGGAVNCHSNGYPSFIACLFASNAAFVGGAIDGGGGGFVMDHCEFNYNRAEEDGRGEGGAVAWSGTGGTVHTRHITNCRFVGNTSQIGGAVFFDGGEPPTICNSTFADNVAFMYGGAAACLNPAYMVNCTFSRNSAWEAWGAVYDQHPNDTVLVNCIVYQSLPEDESIGPFGAVAVRYSCVTGGYDGIGNTDADPLFVDPDGNDYHLTAGSPCIDSGCNGAVPEDFTDLDQDGDTAEITPLDLDGEGRFFDDPDTPDSGCGIAPIVDMGAYEFGDAGAQPCPGDLDGDRDVDQSDLGILLSLWGSSDACDLDCDGDVDQGDLGILLAHWGQSCP